MVSASVAFLVAGAVHYHRARTLCGDHACSGYAVGIVPVEEQE